MCKKINLLCEHLVLGQLATAPSIERVRVLTHKGILTETLKSVKKKICLISDMLIVAME